MSKYLKTNAFNYMEPYRLSRLQVGIVSSYFGFKALMDPTKGHMVAALCDSLGENAGKIMHQKMQENASGRKLLKNKPLISNKLIIDKCYPKGSLGEEYKNYMITHGFNADDRSKVKFNTDPDVAYAIARYRQVHDFWHVLCDIPPTVLGEIALKWFEWNKTGLPSCGLNAILGPIRLTTAEKIQLAKIYIPWAIQASYRSSDLLSYEYEENLELPLEIVRKTLNIQPISDYLKIN